MNRILIDKMDSLLQEGPERGEFQNLEFEELLIEANRTREHLPHVRIVRSL